MYAHIATAMIAVAATILILQNDLISVGPDSVNAEPESRVLVIDLIELARSYPRDEEGEPETRYMQEIQSMLIELTAEGYVVLNSESVVYADNDAILDPQLLIDAAGQRIEGR